MKAVNKDPQPPELERSMEVDPLPAALETFVANLGVSLSDSTEVSIAWVAQKTQRQQRRPFQGKENGRPRTCDTTRILWVTRPHNSSHSRDLTFRSRGTILTGDMTLILHEGSQQRARFDFHRVAGEKQLTGLTSKLFPIGTSVAGDEQHDESQHLSYMNSNANFINSQPPAPREHGSQQRLSVIGGTSASISPEQDSSMRVYRQPCPFPPLPRRLPPMEHLHVSGYCPATVRC